MDFEAVKGKVCVFKKNQLYDLTAYKRLYFGISIRSHLEQNAYLFVSRNDSEQFFNPLITEVTRSFGF